ncbi:DNA alkylation repair protein [marine bacterium AO1-C]|nr:DNA alkylation repair protein [marine bacterium AO1-C]
MNPEILNRKGARKAQDIPQEVLTLLNSGKIETVNLTEWLAIDHLELIKHTFEDIGISTKVLTDIYDQVANQTKPSTMNTTKLVGSLLYEKYAGSDDFQPILKKLSTHQSDSIRCYAPYLIALNDQLTIEEKLDQAKKLVADTHFGVREVVWMALRPGIDKNLDTSIKILSNWATDKDENIRRFTTESTRPRGVWCKHIDALKENPALALPILEPLKSDTVKYVQDSVGNWLNDASKSQPQFVIDLCDQWQQTSPTKETQKIIKRARRTIDKK